MYYNYPCNHFRQQAMTGMNANQMGAMPTMPMQQMQPMMPMMPMMPMGQMDQVGVPPTAGAATPLGTTTGIQPTNIASVPIVPSQIEQPVMDIEYTQGYLKTQIGRKVKVEFLIGTNNTEDREGTLVDVGISYIIINEVETDDLLLCDIYSIKFVRFYF